MNVEKSGVYLTAFTGHRVLIVEDQTIHQHVLIALLQQLGVTYDVAADGREALAKITDEHDMVLMDCVMPNMDGYEATMKIRELEAKTGRRHPIVAVTTETLSGDRRKCFQAGMDDFLNKPLKLDLLIKIFEKWLMPVERQVLDQYIGMKVNNAELITGLLGAFEKVAPEFIQKMRAAVAIKNHESLKKAAHSLKSSSATLGAHRVSAICRDIERSVAIPVGIDVMLKNLEAEIEKAKEVWDER